MINGIDRNEVDELVQHLIDAGFGRIPFRRVTVKTVPRSTPRKRKSGPPPEPSAGFQNTLLQYRKESTTLGK